MTHLTGQTLTYGCKTRYVCLVIDTDAETLEHVIYEHCYKSYFFYFLRKADDLVQKLLYIDESDYR